MSNEWTFDEEITALEELIDDIDSNKESINLHSSKDDNHLNDNVSDLLRLAEKKVIDKYTSIYETEEALNAVLMQARRINESLMEMAKCSQEYANGEIDDKLRCQRIQSIMEDIRIPVKELQFHMGRECDKNGPVTELELRNFRDYLEGFINILQNRISVLKNNNLESKTNDVEYDKEFAEENDEDEYDDLEEKKKSATEFTKVCESLMIDISSSEDGISSSLESLLNDITEL